MKKSGASVAFHLARLLLGLGALPLSPAVHADQVKANNNNHLELGASWSGGIAPAATDNAIWDSTVATPANCTNTLGAAVSWKGIVVNNPSASVLITGNTTLTNGSSGINMGSATVNLTIDCGTLSLGVNQTWTVGPGLTLTTGSPSSSGTVNSPNNGNFIIAKAGGGVWTTSGSGDNGSIGIIINAGTVNFNKTSSSGTHGVGGPGLTVNNGGTARLTGTGGDQVYDGATVTLAAGGTFDLNGNSEAIGGLAGSGGIVDNTAAGKTATLTVGGSMGNGSSTFAGTLQASGSGAALALVKAGSGTLTLSGANTYNGGTTINAGMLALTTTNNVAMAYSITGGVMSVAVVNPSSSLQMTGLAVGGSANAQLTFNLANAANLTVPAISNSGNLTITGNVAVNVQSPPRSGSYVLLRYSGTRSGSGSFVAGSVPVGSTITDDPVAKTVTLTYVAPNSPRVIIPTLNSNETVVAVATPQQYGAAGDGITDDSAAFQAAMNAVFNYGGAGGGVVFVPVGNYAFYTNLTIPTGVTLHGDWTDWTKGGGGLVGTTFKVYFGSGQSNSAPFITMNGSTALRDVNIWYPNQNASSIVSYPFTIGVGSDSVVQNVVLVNSYQGIENLNGGDKHILRTVVGTPLYKGIDLDQIFDVCHAEDLRFSPDVWPASLLTNAPATGGPHGAWMRANGEAMRLRRVDGEMCMDTWLSGYKVGIEANAATNGQPGVTFYSGAVSNCAIALLAQDMPSAFGLMFAWFALDGDIAVERTNTADDANAMFDHCQIVGRNGQAVISTGNDWHSWMQFQDCAISNALTLTGPGVFNVVNCALSGSTQCVMSASATRAAFTGCTFSPTTNLLNQGNASNLIVDARQSISNALPIVYWTNVANNSLSRRAAVTNLYVVTDVPWNAYGNGVNDDSVAIQSALSAAGGAGGGIVYLPAGKYHLTNTLDVPGGVELRGAFEMRHGTRTGQDGRAKGTVIQPYSGQGTTNGPPAIALEANAGLVGVTISYESQNTNCIAFPPAIQGRGANVYAIGICCPNPYAYVDLDTYACSNHLLDMVDGWALRAGYAMGNGSSGTIADCHCNWTYWIDNADSQSSLPQNIQAPVLSFAAHQLQMYLLGNCTELMVKDFSIIENTFANCVAENGQGPDVTLINNYCDATIQGFVLDAAGPSTVRAVNTPMTTFNFGGYGDLAQATVAVLSTTNFQGTARFTSSVLWGGTYLDFGVNGGDVGFDMVHMDNHSFVGSVVNGGAFHLINNSAYISYSGPSNFPPYYVTFGPNAGLAGKVSEFIGCYAYNGCGCINPGSNNPANIWMGYALSAYSILNPSLPAIYNCYPNASSLFDYTNALSFTAISPAGISNNNVVVTVNGVAVTNLDFSGTPTDLSVTDPGLALNRTFTAVITVTDNSNHVVSTTLSFDTFSPNDYTFEAEDFDYTASGVSGLFIDNPQTNAYAGLSSTDGIDYHSVNPGQGAKDYRPNTSALETEAASDIVRPAYSSGLRDYDVGFNSGGNWANYTRTFPAGVYNVYMRGSDGIGASGDSASMAVVVSGRGTTNQALVLLGTFAVPATAGWQSYTWVPLEDSQGNLARLTNSGSIKTLRITTDKGNYNANFYLLALVPAPLSLAVSASDGTATISFPTEMGASYQVEYKNNLSNSNWTALGNPIPGDGGLHFVNDSTSGGSRFYRVKTQ